MTIFYICIFQQNILKDFLNLLYFLGTGFFIFQQNILKDFLNLLYFLGTGFLIFFFFCKSQ